MQLMQKKTPKKTNSEWMELKHSITPDYHKVTAGMTVVHKTTPAKLTRHSHSLLKDIAG